MNGRRCDRSCRAGRGAMRSGEASAGACGLRWETPGGRQRALVLDDGPGPGAVGGSSQECRSPATPQPRRIERRRADETRPDGVIGAVIVTVAASSWLSA